MKFFIDTADVKEITDANELGLVDGVTTNPSLVAKSGRYFHEVLKEIISLVDGPISAEVVATDAAGMVSEAEVLAELDPDKIVIKLPITAEGLKATKVLTQKGLKTNLTLIFSPLPNIPSPAAFATETIMCATAVRTVFAVSEIRVALVREATRQQGAHDKTRVGAACHLGGISIERGDVVGGRSENTGAVSTEAVFRVQDSPIFQRCRLVFQLPFRKK